MSSSVRRFDTALRHAHAATASTSRSTATPRTKTPVSSPAGPLLGRDGRHH